MSNPDQYTAAMAGDPATAPEVLAAIATSRPDLRPAVAANPAAYQELLDWLTLAGDPSVDAVLAARTAVAAEVPAPVPTPVPSTAPPSAMPVRASAGPLTAVPFDLPAASAPALTERVAPGVRRGRRRAAVVALVGVLVLGLAVAAVLLFTDLLGGDGGGGHPAPGADPLLDRLWTGCDSGEWADCDLLYWYAEPDSEYSTFGDSCGMREAVDWGFWCDPASARLADD